VQVRLEEIRKSFGAVEVVKGLDLEIADGQFLVLLGPSGCGKTTALRMVAGLEAVSAGRVFIGAREVTTLLPKYRDIAMVFQSYALYPHMTVAENIGYPLKLRGTARAERDRQVADGAAKVHLEDYLERYPRQLSGGQRQRVALARAIVRRPAAFLMDEPLSNLDAKLRGFMRAELKHLQRELGTTTIYVTHDQIEAMTLADRVAGMQDGVVQQIATPREIYHDPANLFVAGFIGAPPMNFLEGAIEDGAFRSAAGRLDLSGMAPHAKAALGFRPEAARITEPEAGAFKGRIYSTEMTGDQTIVTISVDGGHVTITTDPDFEAPMDLPVGIAVDASKTRAFDAVTGERL
jgi:multiple sugar transport system ATP-binding protein